MVQSRTPADVFFKIILYFILTIMALACLLPFVHIIAVSLSERVAALGGMVGLWPIGFNIINYRRLIEEGPFTRAFSISVFRVLIGTAVNIAVIILTAYPLSVRERFRGKMTFRWFMIFAMLFSGGLIPWYLILRMLGLLDKLAGLVLPGAIQIWSIIIASNFFARLPVEFSEAAEIDGASHWAILFRIHIPLSLPLLAAMTLFAAVGHWNSWFDGLIIMRTTKYYPLQTYLQTTIVQQQWIQWNPVDPEIMMKFSERAWKCAQIVVAAIPILAVYPFLQRYFVTMRIGGIKG